MVRRVVATFVSVVLGAVVGVSTNVFTEGWRWPWGVALGVTVVGVAAAQVWLSRLDRRADQQRANGFDPGGSPADRIGRGGTVVLGDRSVGRVDGGTVISGDQNVVYRPDEGAR